jgi:hypothetical protein
MLPLVVPRTSGRFSPAPSRIEAVVRREQQFRRAIHALNLPVAQARLRKWSAGDRRLGRGQINLGGNFTRCRETSNNVTGRIGTSAAETVRFFSQPIPAGMTPAPVTTTRADWLVAEWKQHGAFVKFSTI